MSKHTAIIPQNTSAALWGLYGVAALHSPHEEDFGLELQGLGSEIWMSKEGIVPIDFLWKVGEAAVNQGPKRAKLARIFLNVIEWNRMFQIECSRMF